MRFRKRALSFLLAFMLLTGAAAGCSDDKKDDKAAETTEENSGGTDDGGESTGSSDPEVKAYCDAVKEYTEKAKDAMSDPAKAADLASEGQELTEKATELQGADLSVEDAQAVADCSKEAAEALTGN